MEEAHLPQPVFTDSRNEFTVCLYNSRHTGAAQQETGGISTSAADDERALLSFCAVPRTRQEIAEFLGIRAVQYAIKRYVEPLIVRGDIILSIPEHPRSRKQTYQARSELPGTPGTGPRPT